MGREPRVTLNEQTLAESAATAPPPNKPNGTHGDPGVRVVTDKRGRKIEIKLPQLLQEFRFVEAAGAEVSANQAWMQMAMPLIYLSKIDGELVVPPRTKREIDALLQELGREGYAAIIPAIRELDGQSEETETQSIKNS